MCIRHSYKAQHAAERASAALRTAAPSRGDVVHSGTPCRQVLERGAADRGRPSELQLDAGPLGQQRQRGARGSALSDSSATRLAKLVAGESAGLLCLHSAAHFSPTSREIPQSERSTSSPWLSPCVRVHQHSCESAPDLSMLPRCPCALRILSFTLGTYSEPGTRRVIYRIVHGLNPKKIEKKIAGRAREP